MKIKKGNILFFHNKLYMIHIPESITDFIHKHKIACPSCNHKIEEKNIITIGLNYYDISINKRCDTHIYIRTICDKCKQITSFSLFPVTIQDFLMEMTYINPPVDAPDKSSSKYSEDDEEYEENDEEEDEEDEIHDKKNKLQKIKRVASKITDEEVNKDAEKLKKCNKWNDICREMGIPPELNNE
jgi:hypothetical protein